jgi:hypothetical protein
MELHPNKWSCTRLDEAPIHKPLFMTYLLISRLFSVGNFENKKYDANKLLKMNSLSNKGGGGGGVYKGRGPDRGLDDLLTRQFS